MNKQAVVSKFSHVKPGDTEFKGGGLRDFFLYRDLGIADATSGQVICHLVKANPDLPPEEGTGWHKHECEFQIVIMTKGWARFMYEDKSTLVQAGDVVHQRPGITHYLLSSAAGCGRLLWCGMWCAASDGGRHLAVNNGVRRQTSDSGAIRSIA